MGNPTIVTMKLRISEIFLASSYKKEKKSADPSTSALSFSIVIIMWPVQTQICGHEGGGFFFLSFSDIIVGDCFSTVWVRVCMCVLPEFLRVDDGRFLYHL